MDKQHSVMLVDDSLAMLGVIQIHLKETEFKVVATARNGDDAIKAFCEHKPELVLLDIVMPGKNGIETLGEIMGIDDAASVIMASSLGTRELVEQSIELGARNFVQKPYEREVLLDVMRNVIDHNQTTQ